MTIAQSKVTAQGQISLPAKIRKKLGLGPGSVLEWSEKGGDIILRKSGRHSSAEIHGVLFADGAKPRAMASPIKEGIKRYMRKKHARN